MLVFLFFLGIVFAIGDPPQVFVGASCDSVIQSLRQFYYVKPDDGQADVANIMDPNHPVGDWIYTQVKSWNGYDGGCGMRDGYLNKVDLQNYRWFIHLEQSMDIMNLNDQPACYWDQLTCSDGAWEVLGVIRAYQIVCGSIQVLKKDDQRYNIFFCRKDAYDEWQKVNIGYMNPYSFLTVAYKAGIPIVNLPSASGGVEALTVDDGSLPSIYIDPSQSINSIVPHVLTPGSTESESSIADGGLTILITTSSIHSVTNSVQSTLTPKGSSTSSTSGSFVSSSGSDLARVSTSTPSSGTVLSKSSSIGAESPSTSSSKAGSSVATVNWLDLLLFILCSI